MPKNPKIVSRNCFSCKYSIEILNSTQTHLGYNKLINLKQCQSCKNNFCSFCLFDKIYCSICDPNGSEGKLKLDRSKKISKCENCGDHQSFQLHCNNCQKKYCDHCSSIYNDCQDCLKNFESWRKITYKKLSQVGLGFNLESCK
jgi:hypothetical protein